MVWPEHDWMSASSMPWLFSQVNRKSAACGGLIDAVMPAAAV